MTFILMIAIFFSFSTHVFASKIPYYQDTEYEDILVSSAGEYVIQFKDDKEVFLESVGRLDIDLSNEAEYCSALDNPYITDNVKKELTRQHLIFDKRKDVKRKVVIFSPFLITNHNGGKSPSITYYTYNGVSMKSERVYSYSVTSQYTTIYSGSSTSSNATLLYNLGVTALGLPNSTFLTILSSGLSVLSAFTSVWGSSFITGETQDYLQISVEYDDIKQWTYASFSGEWLLGLASQQSILTRIYSRQYYWNSTTRTGHTVDTTNTNITTIQSSHFSSPWAYAYQHQFSPVSEWTQWCVGNKTVLF